MGWLDDQVAAAEAAEKKALEVVRIGQRWRATLPGVTGADEIAEVIGIEKWKIIAKRRGHVFSVPTWRWLEWYELEPEDSRSLLTRAWEYLVEASSKL